MPKSNPDTVSRSSIDLDGTEHIFDVTDATFEAVTLGDKFELSVTEAATLLKISKRTLWRRIKAGEFGSRNDGQQTFVTLPVSLQSATDKKSVSLKKPAVTVEVDVLRLKVTELQTELERERVERIAATNQATYLQGQVDVYREQFKLLVDMKSSTSWWHHFKSWFLGGHNG